MIRLDHVYKGFNGNAVLEDISLALPEKGFCAITGPLRPGQDYPAVPHRGAL